METFEDSWEHAHQPYDEWSHWMVERPGFDPDLWVLATADDPMAGIALCASTRPSLGSAGSASSASAARWRGQGLGRALLFESFWRLSARGCERAILGVDASASLTGAHTLYENAGMRVISTFDIYELPS